MTVTTPIIAAYRSPAGDRFRMGGSRLVQQQVNKRAGVPMLWQNAMIRRFLP